ncbi:MAG TPA: hypothetical protein VFQ38_10670 [Longimicrobiales bacterium]|nr:hypothetical protein [Longimicrobiales bacterium]
MRRPLGVLALALAVGACSVEKKEEGNAPPAVEIKPDEIDISTETAKIVTPEIHGEKDTLHVPVPHARVKPLPDSARR